MTVTCETKGEERHLSFHYNSLTSLAFTRQCVRSARLHFNHNKPKQGGPWDRRGAYLDDALARAHRCTVQETIVIGVPLGKTQPLRQVREGLFVAFKHHRIIVDSACFTKHRRRMERHQSRNQLGNNIKVTLKCDYVVTKIIECTVLSSKSYHSVSGKVQIHSGKSLSAARTQIAVPRGQKPLCLRWPPRSLPNILRKRNTNFLTLALSWGYLMNKNTSVYLKYIVLNIMGQEVKVMAAKLVYYNILNCWWKSLV